MPELATTFAAPSAPRQVAPPHCVVVTGPRGAGKTRWLEECIHRLVQQQPALRVGVLLADESPLRKEPVCADTPSVVVRRCFLPCLCCPAAADLTTAVRGLVDASQADWLFIEFPISAAPGLIAEFDRVLHWPRWVIVCLTPTWERAWRKGLPPAFQTLLVETADIRIANSDEAAAAIARVAPGEANAGNLSIAVPRGVGLPVSGRPVCRRS